VLQVTSLLHNGGKCLQCALRRIVVQAEMGKQGMPQVFIPVFEYCHRSVMVTEMSLISGNSLF
jgi:hypothetical protein